MDDPKSHFRAVLIDILDRLGSNDRKKLTFLLGDDIEGCLRDEPTIGKTLDIFQQLLDRGKISDENFNFLIDAFQRIKCHQAAKSLKGSYASAIESSSSYFLCLRIPEEVIKNAFNLPLGNSFVTLRTDAYLSVHRKWFADANDSDSNGK